MDITILYGSQTGNAEDMAKRIGQQAKSLGYQVLVEAADDFPLKDLPKQRFLLFVCSTTGHGQQPENMQNFYNFMRRRDLPSDCLKDLNFAVYGLGSSSYAKFNWVSKIIFRRLKDCGANPVQELVAGDEQHPLGCDGIIYPKLDELWLRLGDYVKPSCNFEESSSLPPSSYILDLVASEVVVTNVFTKDFYSKYHLKTATCTLNKRVTSDAHFQDTRHLCFKTEDELLYEPGDVCAILPSNSDDNVDRFIKILNLNPEQKIKLRKRDPSYMINYLYDFVPDGLSVRELVKYHLDIQSVPKRSFFQFLWPFSQDDLEKGKLFEFASTEGQEDMYEYCIQPKRSILEVLLDFPNTVSHIKLEYILDLVPPIKPRSFSIASALDLHPGEIHLIVGVVEYQTRLRKIRKGLCSNYLARIQPTELSPDEAGLTSKIQFFLKRSEFKLPEDESKPIILVGPGLGIAPFRSFIEKRSVKSFKDAKIYFYFGCRSPNSDYYFEDELKQYAEQSLIKLRVAFSREEPKQYVQDLIFQDSNDIRKLMDDENAHFYVAGNSKLPDDLRVLLAKILTMSTSSLEAHGRLLYDCW